MAAWLLQHGAELRSRTDEGWQPIHVAAHTGQTQLARFQAINVRMWDIVRGSIDLRGAFEKTDRAHFRHAFMNGDLRDAHGLFMWADAFGDMTSIKCQVEVSDQLSPL